MIIKSKKDCKKFLEKYVKNGYPFYCDKYFQYQSWSGTFGYNCWTKLIYRPKTNQYFWYSWGQGWCDQELTEVTEEEIINIIWNDRKYINKELKKAG